MEGFSGNTEGSHMDNFPEHLKDVVNEHWAQFPPRNNFVVLFFGVCFAFLTIVNLVTNSFVIYVYLTNKELCIPVSIGIVTRKSSLVISASHNFSGPISICRLIC